MLKNILVPVVMLLAGSVVAQEPIPLKGEELFGSLRARHIGPALMSGRISDIEGHPSNSRVLYIGAAGGGVWKTSDGGVTFKPIFEKHNQSIGSIAVDPTRPDEVIWVGTGECWTRNSVTIGDGIFKSTDGGNSWTNMGLVKTERIASVQINPEKPDVVYAAAMGPLWGAGTDRGLYRTKDGGKNWEKILYIDENTGCSEVTLDPRNPDIVYAAMWEHRRTAWSFESGGKNSGLYKSTDGGNTWNKIHNGFPAGKLGRIALAIAPSQPNRLYAVIESEQDATKGLYRSEDAGASWKRTNGDFELTLRPFYFSRIVVDPRNPDLLCKGGLSGAISRDGGNTFKTLGTMHSDIHDIWFDFKDSDRMYVATDGGLYRSWDGGGVMEMVKNLPLSQYYQVSIDDAIPYNIYGGLQDNGSWYGPSQSPGGIENRDWHSVGAGDGFRVYRHPTEPTIVYSEMQGAENIWRYDTERKQYKVIKPYPVGNDPKLRFNWNAALNLSPHKPDRLYVGSQFVHRSDDRGETWTKISPDLTTNDLAKQDQASSGGLSVDNSGAENHCTIFSISESPLDENIIWVGTDDGNVQVTTNGGTNWTNVVGNIQGLPKNTWAYQVQPSRFDKNTCYVVFDGHTQNDMKPYVFKTTDMGKSWKSVVTEDIKTFARHILEDTQNPDLLFLGTEMGLYITVDGGQNWSPFTNNMPPVAVHYLALHPKTNDLVMATHGRGIIILDDISPLRQVTNAIIARDVHFFTTSPTIISEQSAFTEGGDAGEFRGENPSQVAQISYYLKSRHTFGKMTLDIFDRDGKKVGELTPGKSKGINIVDWNFRYKMPKVAKGKTIAGGASIPPQLPAGEYRVVLTKAGKTYETSIKLIPDPNSLYTDEDRRLQYSTTMKLYNMTERLAYLVDQVDALGDSLASRKAANPKLGKMIDPMISRLDAMRKELVVTTGDNYVSTAEPELREQIAGVYSEVALYPGRPTDAQMVRLQGLETELKDAEEAIQSIRSLLTKQLTKAKVDDIKLRSWEEFMESN